METTVSPMPQNKRPTKLSNTRTDRDWIMIVLGVVSSDLLSGGRISKLWQDGKKHAPKVAGSCKRSRPPGSQ